jgi:hypothetical protein
MQQAEYPPRYQKNFWLLVIFIIVCILLEIFLYTNLARLEERHYSIRDGILYQFSLQDRKLSAQSNDPNVIIPNINMRIGSISIRCRNSVHGAIGQVFYRNGSEAFDGTKSMMYDASLRERTLVLPMVQYVTSLRLDLTNSPGDVLVCRDLILNPPTSFRLSRRRITVYIGLFLMFALYLFRDVKAIRLVRQKISSNVEDRPAFLFLSFCIIPLLAGISYLFAFYPGVLTFDSVYQWDQLSRFNFSNWHPAYHTILMWLITRIWYSPASIAFVQIVIYSLVLAYGFYTLKEELEIPYVLLILLDVVISINPINGIMAITLWKDVSYGIFVLLLTLFVFKLMNSNGEWIAHKNNWLYFGLAVANISLLRHNGFPVGLGTLLICMVVFRYYMYFVKALLISILFFILITGPLYKIFNVDRAHSQSLGVIFIHPIAAQVHANTKLTKSEQDFLDELFPLKEGWAYSCYDATVFFYQGVNFQPVQKSTLHIAKIFYMLTLRNPAVTLDHFVCLSSFVWQVKQPSNVNLETVYVSNLDVSNYENWRMYQDLVMQKSKLQFLQDLIVKAINYSYAVDPDKVLWRPAIYLYILTIAVFVFSFASLNKSIFALLTPVLIQSLVIAFTAQLQALRYQYPVYLVSMLFSLPLFYSALKLNVQRFKPSN